MKVFEKYKMVKVFTIQWFVFLLIGSQLYAQGPNGSGADTVRLQKEITRTWNKVASTGSASDSTLISFRRLYNESKKIKYTNGIVESLTSIAGWYFYDEQYDNALHSLNEALAVATQAKNNRQVGSVQRFMGTVYINRGNYEAAMEHFLEALKLVPADSEAIKLNITINIASLLLRMGNVMEALEYLNSIESKVLSSDDNFLKSYLLINKGEVYARLDGKNRDLNISNKYIHKGLEIAAQYNLKLVEEPALVLLAKNEIYEGNYKKALSYLEKAYLLQMVNRSSQNEQLILKGKCYRALGEYERSKQILLEAKDNAVKSSKFLLPEIYEELTSLYEDKEEYKTALYYAELSRTESDAQLNNNTRAKIHNLKLLYETAKRDKELVGQSLLIEKQQQMIARKNRLTVSLICGCVVVFFIGWMLYRYRLKIQRINHQKSVWQATIKAEENERTRLAQHLHDSVAGTLSTISIWLSGISEEVNELKGHKEFNEVRDMLDYSIHDVRSTAHHLIPELLIHHGLIEALRINFKNIEKSANLKVDFQQLGFFETLDTDLSLVIYRIVQELIHNVVKHADATACLVQLSYHGDLFLITVEDNGVGMDTAAVLEKGGIGLISIRQTVNYLKGDIKIESSPGKGTSVAIEISLDNRLYSK